MKPLIVIEDDNVIRAMLLRQQIPMAKPTPPNDMIFASMTDNGHFWIVIRFYQPGDEGLLALGLPEPTTGEDRVRLARLLIDHVGESARAAGVDPWAASTFCEVAPVTGN